MVCLFDTIFSTFSFSGVRTIAQCLVMLEKATKQLDDFPGVANETIDPEAYRTAVYKLDRARCTVERCLALQLHWGSRYVIVRNHLVISHFSLVFTVAMNGTLWCPVYLVAVISFWIAMCAVYIECLQKMCSGCHEKVHGSVPLHMVFCFLTTSYVVLSLSKFHNHGYQLLSPLPSCRWP